MTIPHEKDLVERVAHALSRYPYLLRIIAEDTILYRVQSSRHDASPICYRPDSDTRFSDPDRQVGVYYLGFSKEVAVAESFQAGQGVDDQAVLLSRLVHSSLHRIKTARELAVVDIAGLANRATYHKLRDIVQARGQGKEGYLLTRKFSQACMRQEEQIDGLLYPSAVYTVSGGIESCNLVLFSGRGRQVDAVDHQSVLQAELSHGETSLEFLESLGVVLE